MRARSLVSLVAVGAVLLAARAPAAEGRVLGAAVHDADALHMLEELERLYSQAGRPRIVRSGAGPGEGSRRALEQELRDTLHLLQLRALSDRYRSRPRFGKRSEDESSWQKNADTFPDDGPAWLSSYEYYRR